MTPEQMLTRAMEKLRERSLPVENRRDWYVGNHPITFGDKAWRETYGDELKNLVENQCGSIIDKRANPLLPASIEPTSSSAIARENAEWVTVRMSKDAEVIRTIVRNAKWSGTQSIGYVDFARPGLPKPFALDPAHAYAEMNAAGDVVWLCWFWKNLDGIRHATLDTGFERIVFTSNVKDPARPGPGEYKVRDRSLNPLGYVPAAVYDEGKSIIDQLWPLNGSLNMTHALQHVVSNSAALPSTFLFGMLVYDPDTGEIDGPDMDMNPAGGRRDYNIPSARGEDGADRKIEQLLTRSPEEWEAIKTGQRHALWNLGSVPAALADIGGGHPSADALEASGVLFSDVVREDRQIYDGPHARLAQAYVDLRMLALGLRPTFEEFEVHYNPVVMTTETASVERFSKLVDAGVTIRDAAIRCLGMTPAEADEMQANADAASDAAEARAGARFAAGI